MRGKNSLTLGFSCLALLLMIPAASAALPEIPVVVVAQLDLRIEIGPCVDEDDSHPTPSVGFTPTPPPTFYFSFEDPSTGQNKGYTISACYRV